MTKKGLLIATLKVQIPSMIFLVCSYLAMMSFTQEGTMERKYLTGLYLIIGLVVIPFLIGKKFPKIYLGNHPFCIGNAFLPASIALIFIRLNLNIYEGQRTVDGILIVACLALIVMGILKKPVRKIDAPPQPAPPTNQTMH